MIGTKLNFQPYDTRDTITYHMDNDNDIKNGDKGDVFSNTI